MTDAASPGYELSVEVPLPPADEPPAEVPLPSADEPSADAPPADEPLPPLIVVAGATATGKTRLAIELAEAFGGMEIVGADSRQVYRGMDVGTAKVGAADRARVPHHGLDLVDPDEPFTAADFRRHAIDALTGIAARGRAALLVGGTGLYLRAVARGVRLDSTGRDATFRAELEARLDAEGVDVLATELRRAAPTLASTVDLRNPRRVVRALERVHVGGDRPPPVPVGYHGPVLWLGLSVEPAEHARWIADRAAWQFANGLLQEAHALRRRYPQDLRAFSAMGYREAFDVLDGRCTLDEAIARDVARTRAYAKRQRTWFRSEPDVHWLEAGPTAVGAAIRIATPFLEGARIPSDLDRLGAPTLALR